jgi:glycosyltransferase involved in cell wall biosynthesis
MNILLTIHHHLDPNAGAPGATYQIGSHYKELGHSVQYYSFDNLPQDLPEIAKTVFFPYFTSNHIKSGLQNGHFDVVNASTGDAWVWGKILSKISAVKPLLVTQSHGLEHIVHEQCLEEHARGNLQLSWKYSIYHGGFRLWEVQQSLHYSDLVFMLNKNDAEYATRELGINPDKIHVIANGISDSFLNLSVDFSPENLSESISIAQVGSYIARKGTYYGNQALIDVLSRYPKLRISFFGTGCPEEQVHKDFPEFLHSRIKVYPSYNNVELIYLLRNHQILLFPSLSEGFPVALLEAMACGLAPISTDIPGPTEVLTHGKNSLLVPPRNSQAITDALEQLLHDKNKLSNLRSNAHKIAQNYTWKQISEERIEIYQSMLNRNRTHQVKSLKR